MQFIPILSFPFTICCVDDDLLSLKTLERIISNKYPIKMFDDSLKASLFFSNYVSPLSQKLILNSLPEHEDFDTINKIPINFDLDNIINFANQVEHQDEIGILIVDYKMPKINGIDLCKQLKNTSIKKILLTGELDFREATEAFNNQLIDGFVQKDQDLAKNILSFIEVFNKTFFIEKTNNIKNYLETNALLPNSDPIFIEFFNRWLIDNQIIAHYIIDKNGSCLLINKDKEISYLILHTDYSLNNFIKSYEDDEDLETSITSIINREKIPCIIPHINLSDNLENLLKKPNILNGKTNYYWVHEKI